MAEGGGGRTLTSGTAGALGLSSGTLRLARAVWDAESALLHALGLASEPITDIGNSET